VQEILGQGRCHDHHGVHPRAQAWTDGGAQSDRRGLRAGRSTPSCVPTPRSNVRMLRMFWEPGITDNHRLINLT
jgi:hypothetical protein